METSDLSQLPEWEPERFHINDETGSYDMLKLRCSRCEQEFWVRGNWALWSPPSVKAGTRPCPYCFRTAWLPGCHPNKPKVSPPRRVVRRRRKPSA